MVASAHDNANATKCSVSGSWYSDRLAMRRCETTSTPKPPRRAQNLDSVRSILFGKGYADIRISGYASWCFVISGVSLNRYVVFPYLVVAKTSRSTSPLQLPKLLDLPFLLLLLRCAWTPAKSPSDLVGDVDLHLQLFCPTPHQCRILLKHPACDGQVQAFFKEVVRLDTAGDGTHCSYLKIESVRFPRNNNDEEKADVRSVRCL